MHALPYRNEQHAEQPDAAHDQRHTGDREHDRVPTAEDVVGHREIGKDFGSLVVDREILGPAVALPYERCPAPQHVAKVS